jgi:uncharacterized protein
VIDCDEGVSGASALDPRTKIQGTQFAAFYYPWIVILDPQTGGAVELNATPTEGGLATH